MSQPQRLSAAAGLLGPGDPLPVEIVHPGGAAPVLIVCDHAAKAIPRALAGLGVCDGDQCRHIGWDIGAAAISRGLSRRLDAPAVLAGYSRLVVDLNRQPGDPTSIPEVSDDTPVPGNAGLSEADIDARLQTFFWPYHHAITETLGRQWRRAGLPPALVAIHSFTPAMAGRERPWHVGVLWNHDARMAGPLLRALNAVPGLEVGDNEPYSGREVGFTMARHAEAAGLPHVALEIRQDLIADAPGVARWVDVLATALSGILGDPALHKVEMF